MMYKEGRQKVFVNQKVLGFLGAEVTRLFTVADSYLSRGSWNFK